MARRPGFTIVEVLIVVVIMAVLAAAVIPQFSDSAKDAKTSTALFNLNALRTQIQFYQAQHNGKLPSATLVELVSKTNANGTVGNGAAYVYGPFPSADQSNADVDRRELARLLCSQPPQQGTVADWQADGCNFAPCVPVAAVLVAIPPTE